MKSLLENELKAELIHRALNLYQSLYDLSPELIADIYKHYRLLQLSDGQVLLEMGNYCKDFYFVGQGLLIGETVINNHKIINWFCGPNDSCTSISGMYGENPSNEKIYSHGITYCLAVDNSFFQMAYLKYPEFNAIMRKMFEYYLRSSQQRADIIRMGTAKQRYYFYKKTYASYAKSVPTELIANFLGMKSATLLTILKDEEKQLSKHLSIEEKFKEIIDLMEHDNYYLNNNLNLKSFAKDLNISTHFLSEIINTRSSKNFNEFINEYRISYVKNRIVHKADWQHLKLEALGLEAGFKSRSSFFSVFKKYVGVSPLAYVQNLDKTHLNDVISDLV